MPNNTIFSHEDILKMNKIGTFISYWREREITIYEDPLYDYEVVTVGKPITLHPEDRLRANKGLEHVHKLKIESDVNRFIICAEHKSNYKARIENNDWSPSY